MRYLLFLMSAAALSAQPFNGSPVGGLTYVTGAYGNGLRGPGAGGVYASIPDAAFNFAGDFSVSVKFCASVDEGYQSLFSTDKLYIQVYGYSGDVYVTFDGVSWNTSGGDVSNGSCHDISVRRSATTASIFINNTNRGSTTVSSANLGSAGTTGKLLASSVGGGGVPTTSTLDEFSVWTTATPPTCTPCTGSESGLRLLFHLDGNLTDSAGAGGTPPSGTVASAVNLAFNVTCSSAPCTLQVQSYTGACASGTFTNDGTVVTGVTTGIAYVARNDVTVKCYRAVLTGADTLTANTGQITAPGAGTGGTRSY